MEIPIDGLRSLGIPAANIKWTYIVDKNLTVASITSASTIGNITLTIDKDLVIADVTGASTIEEIVLALAGGLLVIADLSSASTIELITLTQN